MEHKQHYKLFHFLRLPKRNLHSKFCISMFTVSSFAADAGKGGITRMSLSTSIWRAHTVWTKKKAADHIIVAFLISNQCEFYLKLKTVSLKITTLTLSLCYVLFCFLTVLLPHTDWWRSHHIRKNRVGNFSFLSLSLGVNSFIWWTHHSC